MRKAAQGTLPADSALLGRAGHVTVDYPHVSGDTLRLVTLSWSVSRRGGGLLDPQDFLTTLHRASCSRPTRSHVNCCLPRGGRSPPNRLHERNPGQSLGSPVLFEVINGRGNTARWLLNHGDPDASSKKIRSEQVLVRRSETDWHVTTGCRFRDLGRRRRYPVAGPWNQLGIAHLRREQRTEHESDTSGLSGRMPPSRLWVVRDAGRSLGRPEPGPSPLLAAGVTVCRLRKGGPGRRRGQTMARTVARRAPYPDGTSPPIAFVHANNFSPISLGPKLPPPLPSGWTVVSTPSGPWRANSL